MDSPRHHGGFEKTNKYIFGIRSAGVASLKWRELFPFHYSLPHNKQQQLD
jgi:hypothetical protein